MERVIRVGIIGCGGIANGKHMKSLQKVENCETHGQKAHHWLSGSVSRRLAVYEAGGN